MSFFAYKHDLKMGAKPQSQEPALPKFRGKFNAVLLSQAARYILAYARGEKNLFETKKVIRSLGIDVSWTYIVRPMFTLKIPGLPRGMSNTVIAVVGKSGLEVGVDFFMKTRNGFQKYLIDNAITQGMVFGFRRILRDAQPSSAGTQRTQV